MTRNYHEGRRKLIFGKPVWEVRMEMRALRQRFNLTDGQCNELLSKMQEIVLESPDPRYQIGAFRAILGAMRLDQIGAIEVMKITGKQIDGVPEDELDNVIDGELADMADSPEAPPLGENSGAEGPGRAEADADDADDPPAGLP